MSKLSRETFRISFPNTECQKAENMRCAKHPCTLKVDRSERTHFLFSHTTRFSCENHTCKAPAAMTCK